MTLYDIYHYIIFYWVRTNPTSTELALEGVKTKTVLEKKFKKNNLL